MMGDAGVPITPYARSTSDRVYGVFLHARARQGKQGKQAERTSQSGTQDAHAWPPHSPQEEDTSVEHEAVLTGDDVHRTGADAEHV